MENRNLARMIELADEFFEAKNDPMQISVNSETMDLLKEIHPSTISEIANANGPIAWVLVIPTTSSLMNEFISKKINENQLLHNTPLGSKYDAVYLCLRACPPRREGQRIGKTPRYRVNYFDQEKTPCQIPLLLGVQY